MELWLVDLERCAEPLEWLERAVPRLTADDQDRAAAITDLRERRHRLAAHSALRILLERIAGPAVRGRALVRPPGGKPRLEAGGAEFSLSHIDGLALIGVSDALPLGVDLESVRPVRLAARRLAEISAAGAGLSDKPLPPLGAERAFLQAWARLEAFTKARGRGLAQTLADVGVRRVGHRALSPPEIEGRARQIAHIEGIDVHDVELSPGLHGAVGAPRGTRPARPRPFPADASKIEQLLARPPNRACGTSS